MSDLEASGPSDRVGAYAVCVIDRGGVWSFWWAAWWGKEAVWLFAPPNEHGTNSWSQPQACYAAEAAVHKALGKVTFVRRLDTSCAVSAAKLQFSEEDGWYWGPDWCGEQISNYRRQHDRERAWRGGAAAPAAAPRAWSTVLGLSWPCTAREVRRAYRRLALKHHPDRGGSDAAFHRLTNAYREALRELETEQAR